MKRLKEEAQDYPVATIAFYGPTPELATKVVVSIMQDENDDPDPLERWFSEDMDVRANRAVWREVSAFLGEHAPKFLIFTEGIIGCPHEEGIDYPKGKSCPQCPYWAGRDRLFSVFEVPYPPTGADPRWCGSRLVRSHSRA